MNIPNLLTVLRVLLIPIFILLFYVPYHWSYMAASSVFAVAAATDWLDGYLARRLQQSTPFGAFLDPVADKLMVAVALVLLVQTHANFWLTLPAAVIIGREIVVSALREWMAEPGRTRACGGVQPWQVEDGSADAGTGDSAGQPTGGDFLGHPGLRAAAGGGGADAVVDGALPAGRLAAPARRFGAEIKVFLNQGVDAVLEIARMAPITTRE